MAPEKISSGDVKLVDHVSFDGEVFAGDDDQTRMTQYLALPGDLVVSKIRARQGSIGIVSPTLGKVSVTCHYRVLIPNSEKIDTQYLWLALRSQFGRSQFLAATGGAMKGEISEDALLRIRVPCPSKAIQSDIVEHWLEAQKAALDARAELDRVVAEIDAWLIERTRAIVFERSGLGLSRRDLKRWDVKTARAAAFRLAHPKFVPFATYAEEATEMVKPRLQPDHEWPVYGVNNKEGVFFSHTQRGAEFNAPYKRIRKDCFFHNPTRSAVGSLGHVPEVPEDAITSPEYQVWRLRDLGRESLQPGFVAVLIRTNWFVRVIQFHRVGAVKQRLYVENLLEMPVPKFPRALQERIAAERAAALTKLAAARKRAEIVKQEVEEMILGVRPAPGV